MSKRREALAEAVSARLHVTTDRITGLTHGIALSADTSAVYEAVDAILASDALARLLAEAWNEGYAAGNSFGYEYAQDTYDGPSEDPTPNPYAPNCTRVEETP